MSDEQKPLTDGREAGREGSRPEKPAAPLNGAAVPQAVVPADLPEQPQPRPAERVQPAAPPRVEGKPPLNPPIAPANKQPAPAVPQPPNPSSGQAQRQTAPPRLPGTAELLRRAFRGDEPAPSLRQTGSLHTDDGAQADVASAPARASENGAPLIAEGRVADVLGSSPHTGVNLPSVKTGEERQGIKCGTCGHVNRVGELMCTNCGSSLVGGEAAILGTKKFNKGEGEVPQSDTAELVRTAGSTRFEPGMKLRLEIEGSPIPLEIVVQQGEMTLGRRDPTMGVMPDIDLTSYSGYRLGVSRMHALVRLRPQALELMDLGSSNGTTVNGVKLMPRQPHVLRDGDAVVLGRMPMRVYFRRQPAD
jgi:hypothetical protein